MSAVMRENHCAVNMAQGLCHTLIAVKHHLLDKPHCEHLRNFSINSATPRSDKASVRELLLAM